MNKDSQIMQNESEAKEWRISQLENALAELMLEIRKGWDNSISITAGISKAYTNANNVLHGGKP